MPNRRKTLSLRVEDEMKILRSRGAKAIGLILGILVGLIALVLVWALWVYPAEYVYRVLAWRESDAFDWQKFPEHLLEAAPTTFYFDQAPGERVGALFEALAGVDDWDTFLEANDTQAFIVAQDGTVLYEKYFNEAWRRASMRAPSILPSSGSCISMAGTGMAHR
jgi:hypothetical protein